MGEAFRYHAALGGALKPVVADRGGGVQPFLDVALFQDVARVLRLVRPDAGQAVGLQLDAHLQRVALGLVQPPLQLLRAVQHAQQVLHVMAHLVRDDIGAGEVAAGAQPALQVEHEVEVDIEFVVLRAVEGAHLRLGKAAA